MVGRFFVLASLLLPVCAAYQDGARVPANNAGEPGTGTPCAGCHVVTLNPPGGRVEITLPAGASFRPGEKQTWTITIVDPDPARRLGFQLTATGGTFTAGTSTVVVPSGGRQFVNQRISAQTYTFDWTPPAEGGDVTVWLAGAACRGRNDTRVYTLSAKLTSGAAKPAIAATGGVVNAASFAAPVAGSAWLTIFGENLAPPGVARSWRAEEMAGGRLPRALEGTSVRLNGRETAIAYVSPTQLNVLSGAEEAVGPVSVEVTTSQGGASAPATVLVAMAAPALFRFDAEGGKYAAAVHGDGVLAGKTGLYGDAVPLRPARPGEVVQFFGTGFGPTEPPTPELTLFSGAYAFRHHSSLRMRIGGENAEILFAGRTAPGLDQINARIPLLPPGDHKVEVEIAGAVSSREVWITVAPQ